jgi:hypothetical protein
VDLTDNKASSTKVDSHHIYLEMIQNLFGKVNMVLETQYTKVNRYYLNNFMQQHKLKQEVITFARVYTTTEDGEIIWYDFTAINVNRQWKDDRTWYGQYAGSYITATLAGQNEENAHSCKKTADEGRFIPELLSLMPLLIK